MRPTRDRINFLERYVNYLIMAEGIPDDKEVPPFYWDSEYILNDQDIDYLKLRYTEKKKELGDKYCYIFQSNRILFPSDAIQICRFGQRCTKNGWFIDKLKKF